MSETYIRTCVHTYVSTYVHMYIRMYVAYIKTHDSESRGQEEAQQRDH